MTRPSKPVLIHAVVDRTTPRYPTAFRVLLAAMVTVGVVLVSTLMISEEFPKLALLLPLLALVVAATHREAFFGDETAISGSIVVICGSFVAFRSSSPVLGPTICGIAAGLHFAHLRRRVWSKAIVNSVTTGVAAAVGSAVYSTWSDGPPSVVTIFVAIPLAVMTYWLIDNALIAVVLNCVTGDKLTALARDLTKAESVMVVFGLAGGAAGLAFRSSGIFVGVLTLAALLVVVDIKVVSRLTMPTLGNGRRIMVPTRFVDLGVLVFVATVGNLAVRNYGLGGSIAAIVIGLAASFVVAFVRLHRRIRIWDRHLALGVATGDAPLVVVFAIGGALGAWAGIWVALGFVCVAVAFGLLAVRWRRRRLDEAAAEDERLASAVELALLDSRDRSSAR